MRFRDFIQEAPMNMKTYSGVVKRLGNSAQIGFEFEMLVPQGTRHFEDDDNRGTQVISYYDTLDEFEEHFEMSKRVYRDIEGDYEAWKDKAREEYAEDNDGDDSGFKEDRHEFRDWLHDEFSTRIDFVHHYDLEPKNGWYTDYGRNASIYTEPIGEPTDGTANKLRMSLDRVVDVPVEVSSSYHEKPKNGRHWYIEPDGSIQGVGHGLEVVSPPMSMNAAMAALDKIFKWMDENDLETNDSTGLHINISVPGIAEKLDPVKLVLFMGEDYALKMFDRLHNTYTRPAIDAILTKIKSDGKIPQLGGEMIAAAKEGISKDKYRTVNFGHLGAGGYLEFRVAGGEDYHRKAADVRKAIYRFTTAVELACDPTLERNEYYKKVAQMFERMSKNMQDNPNLVTKGNLNQLPEELKRLYKYNADIIHAWKHVETGTSDKRLHTIILMQDALDTLRNFKTHLDLRERVFFKKLAKEYSVQSGDIDALYKNDHIGRLAFKKEFGI